MHTCFLKRAPALLMALALLLALLAGCSGSPKEPEPTPEPEPVYPVSIDGVEIIVGETRVQTLLDMGLEITFSEMDANHQITEYTIDPASPVETGTYYSGLSIWITEHTFAHISLCVPLTAAMEKEQLTLGDALVARLEFNFSQNEEDDAKSRVAFNGIQMDEMTREKAGEAFPDFTGDDYMWFSTGLRDYKYGIYFAGTVLNSLTVERKYDVDWGS